jgi:zinc/manganese transport system substrate-binding protein
MNLTPSKHIYILAILLLLVSLFTACRANTSAPTPDTGKPTIIVTYSVLGAVVSDLVGDQATVIVPIPNGQDLHDWEPSARDMEAMTHADLIVQNGLHLEGGMEQALAQAQNAGVPVFTASDHITIRIVGEGEGIPSGDPDQAIGAQDPHLWMDPLAVKQVVIALAETLKNELGLDVSARALELENRLDELNTSIAAQVATLPADQRSLVTGHESLGYFAERYGFSVIGAIVPSLSTQAEVSASELSTLKSLIEVQGVKAIFTELGTPPAVAEAIGQETGVQVVEISTHTIPADGSYFTFMTNLADTIVTALK